MVKRVEKESKRILSQDEQSRWGIKICMKPIVVCGPECRSVWENTAASLMLNTSHQTFIEYLLHAENWKYKDKFHIIPALQ